MPASWRRSLTLTCRHLTPPAQSSWWAAKAWRRSLALSTPSVKRSRRCVSLWALRTAPRAPARTWTSASRTSKTVTETNHKTQNKPGSWSWHLYQYQDDDEWTSLRVKVRLLHFPTSFLRRPLQESTGSTPIRAAPETPSRSSVTLLLERRVCTRARTSTRSVQQSAKTTTVSKNRFIN